MPQEQQAKSDHRESETLARKQLVHSIAKLIVRAQRCKREGQRNQTTPSESEAPKLKADLRHM